MPTPDAEHSSQSSCEVDVERCNFASCVCMCVCVCVGVVYASEYILVLGWRSYGTGGFWY